jgi:hypothetical protein
VAAEPTAAPKRPAGGSGSGAPAAERTVAPQRPASDPRAQLDPRSGSGAPQPVPTAQMRPAGPRRARLMVTRLDPWSVMKTAFMLSVSLSIVIVMALALLWWTLDVTGVFAAIARTVDDLAGTSSTSFDFESLVGFNRVMGIAFVLAAIEIVLVSALSTLFAFLYNLSVGLTGGLEVTLSEDS